jgi:HD-like signal output (HDOD) protein
MPCKSLQDLIADTRELSSLPATTVRLLELLDDMTVDALRVMSIIEKDPSLTANLLKLCNSAYYGMRRQVGSIREALVLLGNETVVTLAFATSMGEIMRGGLSGYDLEKDDLWHHALATAIGASYLIVWTPNRELKDRAFTAGLVHDIGKLLLNRPLSEALERLPGDAAGPGLPEAERRIAGFDHCEAGAALATTWNFPPMLVTPIFHHHRPEAARGDDELLQAVYAANLVAGAVGMGTRNLVSLSFDTLEILSRQGIPEEAIIHLTEHLGDDLRQLLEVLSA